ncbi:MAG: hypothetical protein EA378_08625 [Phycisphaerales bacterium]|nr:MAG: hypothetical protein EA378_08625 [Phycisphaerales bacterium]
MQRKQHRITIGALAATGVAAMLGACETETRVVRQDGMMLANLPGATGGGADPATVTPRSQDVVGLPGGAPREELDDGTVILRARTGRQLMGHLFTTLRNNERELFVAQVLSTRTKQEFHDRGLDPALAFDELKQRSEWIEKLFQRMPQGEFTPGVLMQRQGDRVYRMTVTGMAADGLRWTFMDMVMEDGSWRLRWFGGQ